MSHSQTTTVLYVCQDIDFFLLIILHSYPYLLFCPLRTILPTPHNPAPEALLTFIHTLLALIIILYPVLIIQKEHPPPFFTYIKIPTHPSGVSKTTIASTACVMTQAKSPTLSYRLCGRISIGKYP